MEKYNKTQWIKNETLVSANNLNKIENQLEALTDQSINFNDNITELNSQLNNEIETIQVKDSYAFSSNFIGEYEFIQKIDNTIKLQKKDSSARDISIDNKILIRSLYEIIELDIVSITKENDVFTIEISEDISEYNFSGSSKIYIIKNSEENTSNALSKSCISIGKYSTASGAMTLAIGSYSTVEGHECIVKGYYSHAEGYQTQANGDYSHSEGHRCISESFASHSEGYETQAGSFAHSEGYRTEASEQCSHAEGEETVASGRTSHAEGYRTEASSSYAHAEGEETVASGLRSHAEGFYTKALKVACHAEGSHTEASANYAHAEGYQCMAKKESSHAEGYKTMATGMYSHAEGSNTNAPGDSSHAEGDRSVSPGPCSHAEGYNCQSIGNCSHAEGKDNMAPGEFSHVGGYNSCSVGSYSFSHGQGCNSQGQGTVSFGEGTVALGKNQMVIGSYNITSNSDVFIIGNGTASDSRSNCFAISDTGDILSQGAFSTYSNNYSEMFEWSDGNTNNEDRVGYFVTFDEGTNLIRKANNEDNYILGIVSSSPAVIGDNPTTWKDKYVRDKLGRIVYEDNIEDDKTVKVLKINEDYNKDLNYVSRNNRAEWDTIGILGKLYVYQDGTCEVGSFCKVNAEGKATKSEDQSGYYVIEKNEDVIRIIFK